VAFSRIPAANAAKPLALWPGRPTAQGAALLATPRATTWSHPLPSPQATKPPHGDHLRSALGASNLRTKVSLEGRSSLSLNIRMWKLGLIRRWPEHHSFPAHLLFAVCTAGAALVLASCTRTPAPPFEHEEFALSVVASLIVESDPEDSSGDLRRQVQRAIPTLAQQYKACTPDQKALVRDLVRRFVDYEDSQYADVSRWYAQLEQTVSSHERIAPSSTPQLDILTERTKTLVASLPPRLRESAETQMRGMEAGPRLLLSQLQNGGSLQSSNVLAGLEAAARYDGMRKQSYSTTYKAITGEELTGPFRPGKSSGP
jgi:hypothetical protein